uniref:Phosphatidylethanolamine-binding protein n=1 Tax=Megaselia scalaris TaxID=36166 RepID=T1GU81_MEGSC
MTKAVFNILLLSVVSCVLTLEVVTKEKMEANGVVPDVIDVAPTKSIEVTYPNNLKVSLGNELTPTQVKDQPAVKWEAEEGALYTLLMTDPDAPSRKNPEFGEVRHWLVVNIPGNDISKGQVVFDYIGSGPPKDTDSIQSGKVETTVSVPNNSREGRVKTKARDLIKEYNLGNPIAGNFYQAQYDDYVPVLHAQLGGAPPKAN